MTDPFEHDDSPMLHPRLSVYQLRLFYMLVQLEVDGQIATPLRPLFVHSKRKEYEQFQRDVQRLIDLGMLEIHEEFPEGDDWLGTYVLGCTRYPFGDLYYEEWETWSRNAKGRVEKRHEEIRTFNEYVRSRYDWFLSVELSHRWHADNDVRVSMGENNGPMQVQDGMAFPIEAPSDDELKEMYREELPEIERMARARMNAMIQPERERYASTTPA